MSWCSVLKECCIVTAFCITTPSNQNHLQYTLHSAVTQYYHNVCYNVIKFCFFLLFKMLAVKYLLHKKKNATPNAYSESVNAGQWLSMPFVRKETAWSSQSFVLWSPHSNKGGMSWLSHQRMHPMNCFEREEVVGSCFYFPPVKTRKMPMTKAFLLLWEDENININF